MVLQIRGGRLERLLWVSIAILGFVIATALAFTSSSSSSSRGRILRNMPSPTSSSGDDVVVMMRRTHRGVLLQMVANELTTTTTTTTTTIDSQGDGDDDDLPQIRHDNVDIAALLAANIAARFEEKREMARRTMLQDRLIAAKRQDVLQKEPENATQADNDSQQKTTTTTTRVSFNYAEVQFLIKMLDAYDPTISKDPEEKEEESEATNEPVLVVVEEDLFEEEDADAGSAKADVEAVLSIDKAEIPSKSSDDDKEESARPILSAMSEPDMEIMVVTSMNNDDDDMDTNLDAQKDASPAVGDVVAQDMEILDGEEIDTEESEIVEAASTTLEEELGDNNNEEEKYEEDIKDSESEIETEQVVKVMAEAKSQETVSKVQTEPVKIWDGPNDMESDDEQTVALTTAPESINSGILAAEIPVAKKEAEEKETPAPKLLIDSPKHDDDDTDSIIEAQDGPKLDTPTPPAAVANSRGRTLLLQSFNDFMVDTNKPSYDKILERANSMLNRGKLTTTMMTRLGNQQQQQQQQAKTQESEEGEQQQLFVKGLETSEDEMDEVVISAQARDNEKHDNAQEEEADYSNTVTQDNASQELQDEPEDSEQLETVQEIPRTLIQQDLPGQRYLSKVRGGAEFGTRSSIRTRTCSRGRGRG